MKISTKSILFLLVLFLLATNLAVIITYRNHLKSEEQKINPEIKIPDTQLGKFFRAELNLSDEQNNEFRNFRQQYNHTANKILFDMQSIRNSMIKELDQASPNREQLNLLSEELGIKHIELKSATFDYYFKLQDVLNEEQQIKMASIFQSMLTDEGFAKTPSQGGNNQEGQGRGQRSGQGRGQGRGQGNHDNDSIAH